MQKQREQNQSLQKQSLQKQSLQSKASRSKAYKINSYTKGGKACPKSLFGVIAPAFRFVAHAWVVNRHRVCYGTLVDPASSHTLVSKITPRMPHLLYSETANGSQKQL